MDLPDEPHETGWYWDLRQGQAVSALDRGPADHLLGPYATRAAAEHWRERVEARNEAWDEDDEEWEGAGTKDADAPATDTDR